MIPTTAPNFLINGGAPADKVLSAWNANTRLTDKKPVTRALSTSMQIAAVERALTGQKAIVAEGYSEQHDAKATGDPTAKANAAASLAKGFKDTDALAGQLADLRVVSNALVAPIASFYEAPAVDPATGRRGPPRAKPYVLLDPVKLSPSTTYGALALSKDIELSEIDADIAQAENAAIDRASAERAMMAELDALAASGALSVDSTGSFRGTLRWPQVNVNAAPRVEGFKPRIVDTSSLFARHFRKAIEADARAALDQFYARADVVALTPQQRQKELRRLRSVRRAVERVRIEATWAALEAGETGIWHRADSNPWLLLGIQKP